MGIFAARKGKWGFGADALYMSLGNTKDFTHVSAVADVSQGAYAFYGARRLNDVAELTFGIRWNVLETSVALTGPGGLSVKGDQQWVDPIVGLALRTPGRGRWHAALYSEIGGFGAGSDFAWQLFPTVGFDLGRHVSIDGGWRWLGMDYETGDGLDRFAYDMVIQGPRSVWRFASESGMRWREASHETSITPVVDGPDSGGGPAAVSAWPARSTGQGRRPEAVARGQRRQAEAVQVGRNHGHQHEGRGEVPDPEAVLLWP
jgi:hypothetical protein